MVVTCLYTFSYLTRLLFLVNIKSINNSRLKKKKNIENITQNIDSNKYNENETSKDKTYIDDKHIVVMKSKRKKKYKN